MCIHSFIHSLYFMWIFKWVESAKVDRHSSHINFVGSLHNLVSFSYEEGGLVVFGVMVIHFPTSDVCEFRTFFNVLWNKAKSEINECCSSDVSTFSYCQWKIKFFITVVYFWENNLLATEFYLCEVPISLVRLVWYDTDIHFDAGERRSHD